MVDPNDASTLVELVERRARDEPRREAFRFGGRGHTYGELQEGIERSAALFAERGLGRGDRAVLVLPNGPELFAAFYGAQRLGAIPVPISPQSGVDRIADFVSLCGAAAAVFPEAASAELLERVAAATGLGRGVVTGRDAAGLAPLPRARDRPQIRAEEIAFLQYTSGTTGDPKGVILTHRHLLTNVRQMIAGMEITPDDVFVSWLPTHHDMGLVLMTMVPFYLGARLVLLPSTLRDVGLWLAAITEHGGTFTAAPDFAYRLCLLAVRDPSRYDLRTLRVALDAAEPVRADTLRRFEERFGLHRVLVPGYGLAEATVGVSMQPPGTAPKVSERDLVAIGRPFPGVRLEIVALGGSARPARSARPVRAGEVGELVVESPAATPGYFRNPRATAELFWRPGAIRTGDLAYRDEEGDVFLVGRSKNIILQAGRNLAPQEIEETVEVLPFVRRAAAVGIDRGRVEGEQAYVFAELRRAVPPSPSVLAEWVLQVVERVNERLGMRPARVVLLKPRSIPRTANGKLRHGALRDAYLDGSLSATGRIVDPQPPPAAPAPTAPPAP